MKKGALRVLVPALALLLILACSPQREPRLASPAPVLEPSMFENMKTYCFGRYLVDVPRDAALIAHGIEYLGRRINVKQDMTRKEFNAWIEESKSDLKDKKSNVDNHGFDREINISDNEWILIGVRDRTHGRSYWIESFKYDQGTMFATRNSPSAEHIDKWVDRLTTYLHAVRYRPDNEIPEEPGVCFQDGFIANGEDMGLVERATLAFALKDYPDIVINIKSDVSFVAFPSLLERLDTPSLEKQFPGQLKSVREGKREINGMLGDEGLHYYLSDDKSGYTHDFIWETLGEVGNANKPYIRVKINSGKGVFGVNQASSLNTEDIAKLYEAIVKTIRLRPTREGAVASPPFDIYIIETGP